MNYFDLHCDTAYECCLNGIGFDNDITAVNSSAAKRFENWVQTFAVWIRDDIDDPFGNYNRILSDIKAKLAGKPKNLTPVFSVEGGAVIEKDAERIETLKNDGIRFMTLTWNGENRIAGGSKTDRGLTSFGKRVIKKMNEVGMVCDVSHLNDKSFYQVIWRADRVISSHSNCREVCNVPRNLSDEQIRLIAERGGIIGLCFYPPFLGADVNEKLYENIVHLLDMGLEDHIAIGSDFDGGEMEKCLDSAEKIPELYCRLSGLSISDRILDKIFYKNADNYMRNL